MNQLPLNPGIFAMKASEGAWKPYPHLNLVIELLLYVIQGRVSRTMIFMPPRHGKSELISYYFLTWLFGYFPDTRVILTTHSARFSRKWGRRVRNLLKAVGKDIFPEPIELAEDSQAAGQWDIKNHKGGLVTAGVGGSILGEGANGFIIDDPTKGFKKAASKTHQQELNDWWYTEAKTRLDADLNNGRKPWVVGIWQRLNVNDLAGQILKEEPQIPFTTAIELLRNGGSIPYGTWVILNLPAIAEAEDPLGRKPGEPLWQEKIPIKELEAIRKEMGSFRFEALYQGVPRNPEGDIFHRSDFQNSKVHDNDIILHTIDMPKLRYWDFAASGEKGDATAGILSAWDGEYLYFLKLKHGRYKATQVLTYYVETTLQDGKEVVSRIEQEPGSGSKLLIKKFQRMRKLQGYHIRPDKLSKNKDGDKLTRSFDLQALVEDHKVKIASSIFDKVVNELVEFTGEEGGEDNIVDTCTGSARYWLRPRRRIRV